MTAYLAIDKLDGLWALSITVASTICGTGLVVLVLFRSSVSVHLDEVQSTVQATGQVGDINLEGELLVQQLEHLVLRVTRHHVETRPNIDGSVVCDEAQCQVTATGFDAISLGVVSAFEVAILCASRGVGAVGYVPR